MKLKILLVVAAVGYFAAAADVNGSFDTYIKTVPELKGEVTSPAAWVDAWGLLSFSIGLSNPVSFSGGTGHQSTPNLSSLNVQKQLDRASVMSMLKLVQGNHLDSVTLSCVNHATNALVYEIKLEEVYFESVQHSGSGGGDDKPTESVSLAYGKITWTYYPPTGPAITAFWDLRTGTGG